MNELILIDRGLTQTEMIKRAILAITRHTERYFICGAMGGSLLFDYIHQ